ncbi:MAG: c-type cytochrome [Anaerolineales bacterium]|nr:c-type cytochrome [Anaerolineales bacterium]
MLITILVFLVLLALTLGAGWLTWRAVRAKRLWVKIAGGLGAGLGTLVLAAVTFFGGKGLAAFYFPGAPAAPSLVVAGTPEQVARGEYLVTIACRGCHSAVDAQGMPTGELPLSGGFNLSVAEGFGFIGDMTAENLTPGGKLAGYSDGDIFRVLRHGVNQDGHVLALMASLPYNQLSDADTQAIIAYLRSLPPVATTGQTGDNLNYIGAAMFGAGMFGPARPPSPETVTAPPAGITAEYGRYVATFGECRGCHGPDMTGTAATSVSPAIPNPRPLVDTLTADQFVAMMRSGVRPDGVAFAEGMPWQNAAAMTDDDLAALYTYIKAPLP